MQRSTVVRVGLLILLAVVACTDPTAPKPKCLVITLCPIVTDRH